MKFLLYIFIFLLGVILKSSSYSPSSIDLEFVKFFRKEISRQGSKIQISDLKSIKKEKVFEKKFEKKKLPERRRLHSILTKNQGVIDDPYEELILGKDRKSGEGKSEGFATTTEIDSNQKNELDQVRVDNNMG